MTPPFWAASYRTMQNHLIITIGRQFGSGGRSVAKLISQKTGIPAYDNDLLAEAAKESGFSPDLFKKRDEKRHLFWMARLFSNQLSNATNYMGDTALFQMQCEAIRSIAGKGSCIIIGRAADYILRDEPGLVRVFLTSPFQVRVERVKERMGLDAATCEKIIHKKESNRAKFYNGYTLGKWGDAATYDLCIDSSKLGIEGTADYIIDYLKRCGLLG